MTDTAHQVELLDQFLDTIVREPGTVAPQELDEEEARFIRAVALVERGVAPSPTVRERVWHRVLVAACDEATSAPSKARRVRHFAGLHPAQVTGVAAALLLVLAIGLWNSPGVRAQMDRLLCFVPGLGIRACEPTALAATGPVSASRDGATLTVKSLLSTGGEATVQMEITGLPSTPSVPPQQVRLALRDDRGKTYPPASRVWSMSAGGAVAAGGSQTFRAEAIFVGLDADARTAEVVVDGPAPVGAWQVRVPLTLAQQAGLLAAREAQGAVSLHGITVRVASVLADRERTVVQLVATTEPPFRFVRGVGGFRGDRQLVLRDGQGREYAELRSPGR
ncbi:MAG: hypothetical protein HY690_19130, partial [Chloroflexi bacterium]|nr:hypothetical protein [Chloroflexota bacterium]